MYISSSMERIFYVKSVKSHIQPIFFFDPLEMAPIPSHYHASVIKGHSSYDGISTHNLTFSSKNSMQFQLSSERRSFYFLPFFVQVDSKYTLKVKIEYLSFRGANNRK